MNQGVNFISALTPTCFSHLLAHTLPALVASQAWALPGDLSVRHSRRAGLDTSIHGAGTDRSWGLHLEAADGSLWHQGGHESTRKARVWVSAL